MPEKWSESEVFVDIIFSSWLHIAAVHYRCIQQDRFDASWDHNLYRMWYVTLSLYIKSLKAQKQSKK